MSNTFSRNRSRAQPHPKICKSKVPSPGAPPPWNDNVLQLMVAADDPYPFAPASLHRVVSLAKQPGLYDWRANFSTGDGNAWSLVAIGNELAHELQISLGWISSGGIPGEMTAAGEMWLAGQPYDSGLVDVLSFIFHVPCGTARATI